MKLTLIKSDLKSDLKGVKANAEKVLETYLKKNEGNLEINLATLLVDLKNDFSSEMKYVGEKRLKEVIRISPKIVPEPNFKMSYKFSKIGDITCDEFYIGYKKCSVHKTTQKVYLDQAWEFDLFVRSSGTGSWLLGIKLFEMIGNKSKKRIPKKLSYKYDHLDSRKGESVHEEIQIDQITNPKY